MRKPHATRLAAALLVPAMAGPALAQTYTAIDCPGYAYTHTFGMNDFGALVGDCELLDGKISGYVVDRGNWTIIDGPGAVSTTAWDINNRGAIVGDYYGEDFIFHGYLYVDGNLTPVDFPGAVHTSAQGIDEFGRIVGIYIDDTDTWRGFILAENQYRAIEPPNSVFTTAVGINGLDIVGDAEIDGLSQGFHLKLGRFRPIAFPGADTTTANRINNAGEIVGTWGTDADPDAGHGYVLTKHGYESFDVPGAEITTGRDINSHGHIVGSFRDADEIVHGYLRVPPPERRGR